MIKLRIIGSPELSGADGSQLLSVLHRPRLLALLSYLAVESLGTYQRRDKLLGLFWPESEEHKARSSLSEALSRLRRSLGPDVVLTRGSDEVALSATDFWCDAAALQEASRESDLEEVVRLYRGPLLDGFFLDELRGFDNWLDGTRARLARIALEALGSLTDTAAASGDARALEWAERAVALFPADGSSVRRLMTLQASAGHRAGALDAFEHYSRRLEEERGLEPSQDIADLASRISAGESFEAPEAVGPQPSAPSTGPTSDLEETSRPEVTAPSRPVEPSDARRDTTARRRPSVAVVSAAVIITFAGIASWTRFGPPRPRPVVSVEVTPPEGSAVRTTPGTVGFTVSPNGEHFVYVGEGGGGGQLWHRRLADLEPTAIPGTEGAAGPVFSPDGSSVAFSRANSVQTVSLAGGIPFTVVDDLFDDPDPVLDVPNLDWASDGWIYYTLGTGIYRVSATGGSPESVTEPAETRVGSPHVLPGGRGLLVSLRKSAFTAAVAVVTPTGTEIRELFPGTSARYSTPGEVVYATTEGSVRAVPFDLERLEVDGPHRTLLENVQVSVGTSAVPSVRWTLSPSGTLLYREAGVATSYQAVWVDRSGRASEIDQNWTFGGHTRWSGLAISPDGERLAVSVPGNGVDIWIKRLDGGSAERFTLTRRGNMRPSWSPDAEYLTYVRDRSQGEWEIAQKRVDGTGEVETLVPDPGGMATYSQDGQWLIYSAEKPTSDIFAMRIGVDSVGRALVATESDEFNPVLSPDGRWLAYTSNETGRFEVYVRSFPDVGSLEKQVSTSGGTEVVWSRSGRELFYRDEAGELIAVDVVTDPTFSVRRHSPLFSAAGYLASPTHPIYDVRADGQAFVMLRAVGGEPGKLILVQNLLVH